MTIIKKAIMIFIVLLACLILLMFGLTIPNWPSKAELCRDVERYLPQDECSRQENALEIVKRAFPEGGVSSSDVKGALGKYLHREYPASYGHIEVYYLSISPIDYFFKNFDSYHFRYDRNGVLLAFDHYD